MCYNTHDNVHIIPKNCCQMCIFIGAVVQRLGEYAGTNFQEERIFEIPVNTQPDPFRSCNYFISWGGSLVTRVYADEENRFIMLRPGRVEIDMRGYPTEKMGYNGKILYGKWVTIWRAWENQDSIDVQQWFGGYKELITQPTRERTIPSKQAWFFITSRTSSQCRVKTMITLGYERKAYLLPYSNDLIVKL